MSKYDVFLSFRGPDTRRSFISFLHKELDRRKIQTFKDDDGLKCGREISQELVRAIEASRFAVVVVSANYAASPWCLGELVKIMELVDKDSLTVIPIFYGVNPSHLKSQTEEVAEQFKKHESREDPQKVLSWRQALTNLATYSGDCSWQWDDDWKMVDEITERISKKLVGVTGTPRRGSSIVGINRHMKELHRLLDLNSDRPVRVVGIWARGGTCRSALARFAYESISRDFDSHCFLGDVKKISQGHHLSDLHEEFVKKVQGRHLSKSTVKNQKVLLVADDVSKLDQIDALAEDFNGFGPGSVVIITTQDKQLFASYGIKNVYEVELLRFQKVRQLIRQLAFKQTGIAAAFQSVRGWLTSLALKWLGWLRGKPGSGSRKLLE
ncbi:unnamed protein product [Microthlaspi erraticum]|uniref:TIR domain-containing protein n=1 Tax=Microthlaspi erraticum TaxID=1685480 RepID=A0A6D2JHS9_9BRAS|nr:unnamed protein product [Microthlaspi erraticum]